jgi:hypothetical protein
MSVAEGSKNGQEELFRDQDVEHVRMLVGQLASDEELRLVQAREQELVHRLKDLERHCGEMAGRMGDLGISGGR